MVEHARCPWVSVFISSFVLTPSILGEEDRDQLVATARDGNRAAILSITSMECRYERRPWANTTVEQADKYFYKFSPGWFWRCGDVYRLLKPINDGTTLDYVVRNGKGLFLRKGGPMPRPNLTFGTLRPVDGIGGEMWQWLLFSHYGQVYISFYPFHEILQKPHVIRTAERLPPPDRNIHIELTHDNGRLEFWFDPKVNYLIRKSVMVSSGDKTIRFEDEVAEFAEPSPAIFVPIVIEHRCFLKGELQAVIRTILSGLKVNKPLDANALRIPGIAGMDCVDLNRDMRYQVDADGNRVGPETKVPVARVSPPARSGGGFLPPKDLFSFFRHPSQPSEPPTPTWVWILIVSAIVLAAALVWAIVRRRRQDAQT